MFCSKVLNKVKYITVSDNWYPNFNNNQVKIILGMFSYNESYYVKLMAWGADDFGLEICKENLTFQEAIKLYNNEMNTLYESIPNITNKDWFYSHGFERF